MSSETFIYITIISTSGALNGLLFLYALTDKTRSPVMRAFAGVTATAALYCFGTALELASSTLRAIKFWLSVAYLGMAFSPPFLVILISRYTGADKWLTRRTAWLLFVIPAVTCLLVATNDLHHLFYKSVFLRPDSPSPMADIVIGPWYIVHGSYTFGSMFLGVCLLAGQWRTASAAYRRQIFTLFVGLMLPITAAFLYLMGLVPYNMDPVPFILILTTSLYVWAIRTADLFQVVPIARGHVFESMRDGVVVLDLSGRLVDFNPAARAMLPELSPERIGEMPEFLREEGAAATGAGPAPLAERVWRSRWQREGEVRHYEIRSLPVRVRDSRQVGRMLMLIDVTEHVRSEETLRRLASYDGLTGFFNRATFMEEAGLRLEEAGRSGSSLSLVLFDVDHFKNINDRLGHAAGDQALVHLARVCQAELQEGEFLGRYGGEEFVLCLPGTGLTAACRRTERIRAAIAGTPLATAAGPLRLTASFGVVEAGGRADCGLAGTRPAADGGLAEARPAVDGGLMGMNTAAHQGLAEREMAASRGPGLETLLQAADRALYQAKAGGRNAVYSHPGGRVTAEESKV